MSNKKNILITRELPSKSSYFTWAQLNNFDVIHRAFIKFNPIVNLNIPETDWELAKLIELQIAALLIFPELIKD